MATCRLVLLSMMITAMLPICACTKNGAGGPDKQDREKSGQQRGAEAPNVGLINVIKNGKLVNFESVTIGNAFDSYRYLTKKAWKQTVLQSGHKTVTFVGWSEPESLNDEDMKNGIRGRGLEVMFVINPDGSYYVLMVSTVEAKADGTIYRNQLRDNAGILANIYANSKITF